jgi:hypothetical protein
MFLEKIRVINLRSIALIDRAYLFAGSALILYMFTIWIAPEIVLLRQCMLVLTLAAFAIGFILNFSPYLAKIWSHTIGKTMVIVANLFALILIAATARHFVSMALGLPAQDFDLTVSFVSLVLFIPVWSALSAVILLTLLLIFELKVFLKIINRSPAVDVFKALAHFAGAGVTCWMAITIFEFTLNHEQDFYQPIRWLAYYFDYQPAQKYPRVLNNERVRLHENGVISVATSNNGKIEILIHHYSP